MRKLALSTFACCIGLASISHAETTTTKYKFKGNTVTGNAESGDDGCFSAGLAVMASDDMTKDESGSTTTKSLRISYFGRDLCNFLSFGGDTTSVLTVPIANQTSITFPFDFLVNYVQTETGERFQKRITGTVMITATGEFEKSRRTEISQNQLVRTVTRSKGITREATLSLSARLDGQPVSLPITTAEIGTTKNGTMEVTRY